MAEVHQLPNVDQAMREASEWIARLHAEDVSAEDRARFDTWRAANPRHARAYEELSATWQSLTRSGPLVRAVSFGQAMTAATAPRNPSRRRAMLLAAASIGAVALGAAWYASHLKAESSFQTAIGEHATVALPDGSTLELNSNSLARIEYTKAARMIRLERGEAFFAVAHDVRRPFWVVADGSWVRAVGTAFSVYVRSSDVQVTVSEGTVKVAGDTPAREAPSDAALAQAAVSVLTAGEQASVHGRAAQIRAMKPAELTRSVAWRQGILSFENRPLGEVVEEISRYTTLKIGIHDDALRRLPVGGSFQTNPDGAEALLTQLADGLGLTVRREGGDAVVVERGPTP